MPSLRISWFLYYYKLGPMAQVISLFLVLLRGRPSICGPAGFFWAWGSGADKFRHKEFNNTSFVIFIFPSVYGTSGIHQYCPYRKVTPRDQMVLLYGRPGLQADRKSLVLHGFYHSPLLYSQSNAASLAICICSQHNFPSRPCLNGCLFHSLTCHKHLSSI